MRQKLFNDLRSNQCNCCACDRWKKITVHFNVPTHTQSLHRRHLRQSFSSAHSFFFLHTDNYNYKLTHTHWVPRIHNNSIDELDKKKKKLLCFWFFLQHIVCCLVSALMPATTDDPCLIPNAHQFSLFLSDCRIFFTLVHVIVARSSRWTDFTWKMYYNYNFNTFCSLRGTTTVAMLLPSPPPPLPFTHTDGATCIFLFANCYSSLHQSRRERKTNCVFVNSTKHTHTLELINCDDNSHDIIFQVENCILIIIKIVRKKKKKKKTKLLLKR